jgi:hypothetical protein
VARVRKVDYKCEARDVTEAREARAAREAREAREVRQAREARVLQGFYKSVARVVVYSK